MNSTLYIILGFVILALLYFLITWGVCSLYFSVSKEKVGLLKNVKISSSLAGVGLVSTILLMVVVSSLNIYLFSIVTLAVSMGVYYGVLKFLWKYSNFDGIIIASTLAIILNPAWLRLMGIL